MKHCFVLDDSEIIRKYARLIFESLAFRVSDHSDPAAMFPRFASDCPDLVLLDWRIPGTNMHEVIVKLRALCGPERPYILYMTSENDYADVQVAYKAGANGHLLKPFNQDIIKMKLQDIRMAA